MILQDAQRGGISFCSLRGGSDGRREYRGTPRKESYLVDSKCPWSSASCIASHGSPPRGSLQLFPSSFRS
jgi:hypothetical protein